MVTPTGRQRAYFGATLVVVLMVLLPRANAAAAEIQPKVRRFEAPAPLGRVSLNLPELRDYKVPKELAQLMRAALKDHWALRELEAGGDGTKLAQAREVASRSRQAVLPQLEATRLDGAAAILRALLQEALVDELFSEDMAFYKRELQAFESCKGSDCRRPLVPMVDYNEVIGMLAEAMPSEHASKLLVANYYLQGLLFEAQGDEVGAVDMLTAALEAGDSKLVSVVQQHLGDLEIRAGNLSRAAAYYDSVTEGKYYALALVKDAWVKWRQGACRDVVQLTAKFRHTVSAESQQSRYRDTVIAYEVDCAAYELRDEDVVALDPKGVSQVREAIVQLERARGLRGLSTVVSEDLGSCLTRAHERDQDVPETLVTLRGTTLEPELRWKRPPEMSEDEETYHEEPESKLVSFMEACVSKRLERYPKRHTLAGEFVLRPR